jgi:hypothetical protein
MKSNHNGVNVNVYDTTKYTMSIKPDNKGTVTSKSSTISKPSTNNTSTTGKPSINKTSTTGKSSSKKIPKDDGPKIKTKHKSSDIMDALMTTSIFDAPPKQKITEKGPLKKEIEIDIEKDSQEDIIRKLVLNIRNLRAELDDHKIYSDGTFCTQSVHNRSIDTLEKKIEDLTSIVDEFNV